MIPTLNPLTIGGMPPLRDYVALAAKGNFRGVEFSMADAIALSREITWDGVRNVFIEHNVAPACFDLPVEWRLDEDTFLADMKSLLFSLQAAQELACARATTILPPAVRGSRHDYLTQTIHRLHCIARVLGDNGIRLGLEWIGVEENHERDSLEGWQRFIWNMRQALDLVDDVCAPDENVGLVVDALNWHVAGDTMDNLLALMPDQVVHVRICDAPNKPIRQLAETERLLPGDGHIDLRGFLEGLQHMHYRAFVAVEACGEDLGPGDSEQAAIRAGSSLNSMLESFHRWDDSVPAHLATAHAGKDRAARA